MKESRKTYPQFFKSMVSKKTTKSNLLQIDFLDITINLIKGKYWPYRKPGDIPLYINANSNHPPNIKKTINQNDFMKLIKKFIQLYKNSIKQSRNINKPLKKVNTGKINLCKTRSKKNRSIQLNLKKQIKKQNKKDYLVQSPFQ